MSQKIQVRRGTAAQWTTVDPTLDAGEIGFEVDTGRFKIGNGSQVWAALSYFQDIGSAATDAELAAAVATLNTAISAKQDASTAATDAELAALDADVDTAIAALNTAIAAKQDASIAATDAELAAAVASLTTAINAKQDASTAATDAELTAAVTALNAKQPINVRDHGATGDGTTDDTSAIQTAITAARAAGRRVHIPAGTYRVTGSLLTSSDRSPVTISGDGPGQTVLLHAASGLPIFDLLGAIGSTRAVTAAAAKGAQTITLASTAGLIDGSILFLRDTTQTFSGASGNVQTHVAGEVARVRSVNGNDVTLYGRLDFSYTTSADARLLDPALGFTLRDLAIRNPTPGTMSAASRGVAITYAQRVNIDNVRFEDLDDDAIRLSSVVDFRVTDCDFYNLRDLETGATTGTPYGVMAVNYCTSGLVKGCRQRYGRHLFTTGNTTTEGPSSHILVSDCIANESSEAAFDTHPGCREITFVDCVAHNTASHGFQIRGVDCRVINPVVRGALTGVSAPYGVDSLLIEGGHLVDCATAISIDASNDVRVQRVTIRGATTGVLVDKRFTFSTMTGLIVRDCDIDATTPFTWTHWDSTFIVENVRTPGSRDGALPTGVAGETFPRRMATSATLSPLTSGTLRLVQVQLTAGQRIAKIGAVPSDAGSVLTNLWYALYDKNLNLLGVTADNGSAALTAGTMLQLALANPVVAKYTGHFYIGIVAVATTPPGIRGYQTSSNLNGLDPVVTANANTGLTTPATAPATATLGSTQAIIPYAQARLT